MEEISKKFVKDLFGVELQEQNKAPLKFADMTQLIAKFKEKSQNLFNSQEQKVLEEILKTKAEPGAAAKGSQADSTPLTLHQDKFSISEDMHYLATWDESSVDPFKILKLPSCQQLVKTSDKPNQQELVRVIFFSDSRLFAVVYSESVDIYRINASTFEQVGSSDFENARRGVCSLPSLGQSPAANWPAQLGKPLWTENSQFGFALSGRKVLKYGIQVDMWKYKHKILVAMQDFSFFTIDFHFITEGKEGLDFEESMVHVAKVDASALQAESLSRSQNPMKQHLTGFKVGKQWFCVLLQAAKQMMRVKRFSIKIHFEQPSDHTGELYQLIPLSSMKETDVYGEAVFLLPNHAASTLSTPRMPLTFAKDNYFHIFDLSSFTLTKLKDFSLKEQTEKTELSPDGEHIIRLHKVKSTAKKEKTSQSGPSEEKPASTTVLRVYSLTDPEKPVMIKTVKTAVSQIDTIVFNNNCTLLLSRLGTPAASQTFTLHNPIPMGLYFERKIVDATLEKIHSKAEEMNSYACINSGQIVYSDSESVFYKDMDFDDELGESKNPYFSCLLGKDATNEASKQLVKDAERIIDVREIKNTTFIWIVIGSRDNKMLSTPNYNKKPLYHDVTQVYLAQANDNTFMKPIFTILDDSQPFQSPLVMISRDGEDLAFVDANNKLVMIDLSLKSLGGSAARLPSKEESRVFQDEPSADDSQTLLNKHREDQSDLKQKVAISIGKRDLIKMIRDWIHRFFSSSAAIPLRQVTDYNRSADCRYLVDSGKLIKVSSEPSAKSNVGYKVYFYDRNGQVDSVIEVSTVDWVDVAELEVAIVSKTLFLMSNNWIVVVLLGGKLPSSQQFNLNFNLSLAKRDIDWADSKIAINQRRDTVVFAMAPNQLAASKARHRFFVWKLPGDPASPNKPSELDLDDPVSMVEFVEVASDQPNPSTSVEYLFLLSTKMTLFIFDKSPACQFAPCSVVQVCPVGSYLFLGMERHPNESSFTFNYINTDINNMSVHSVTIEDVFEYEFHYLHDLFGHVQAVFQADPDSQPELLEHLCQLFSTWERVLLETCPLYTMVVYFLNDERLMSHYLKLVPFELICKKHLIWELLLTLEHTFDKSAKEFIKTYIDFVETSKSYPSVNTEVVCSSIIQGTYRQNSAFSTLLKKLVFSPTRLTRTGKLNSEKNSIITLDTLQPDESNKIEQINRKMNSLMDSRPAEQLSYCLYESTIKMDLEMGSEFSHKFFSYLRSLPNEQFEDTFYSSLIQAKMNQIFLPLVLHSLVSILLVSLVLSYFSPSRQDWMPPFILTLNSILLLFELMQWIFDFKSQVVLVSGLVRFFSHLLCYYVTVVAYQWPELEDSRINRWFKLALLVLFGFVGLDIFGVLEQTKFIIIKLYKVFAGVIPLLVIFAYCIVSLAFLYIYSENFSQYPKPALSFYRSVVKFIDVIFGVFSADQVTIFQFILLTVGNLILNLTLANLLIALVSEVYDKIEDKKEIYIIRSNIQYVLYFDCSFRWLCRKKKASFKRISVIKSEEESADIEAIVGQIERILEAVKKEETESIEWLKRESDAMGERINQLREIANLTRT